MAHPDYTMKKIKEFLMAIERPKEVLVISTWPIETDFYQQNYGSFRSTFSFYWSNYPILPFLEHFLPNVKWIWLSEASCYAYGEAKRGAGFMKENLIYYDLGHELHIGSVQQGQLLTPSLDTEASHQLVLPYPKDDKVGVCFFHKGCLSGKISLYALEENYHFKPELKEKTSSFLLKMVSYYLGQSIYNLYTSYRYDCFILGGELVKLWPSLIEETRQAFVENNHDYFSLPVPLNDFICSDELKEEAVLLGAFLWEKERLVIR